VSGAFHGKSARDSFPHLCQSVEGDGADSKFGIRSIKGEKEPLDKGLASPLGGELKQAVVAYACE